MAARIRYRPRLLARAAILTAAAAAFVLVASGLPAQAQGLNIDFNLFPPAPAYQSNCSTFSYGGFSYTSCDNPTYAPSNVYSPYYGPAYMPYYAPAPVVYYESPYYYYGP